MGKSRSEIQSEESMSKAITYDQVAAKIIMLRDQKAILDSDVADLYGIETKKINQAIKRNPAKFPDGYVVELNDVEWNEVRSQIVTSPLGGGRSYKPTAFTERGLYMLATILKSPQAVATTIAIIDTFAQVKELTRSIYQFAKAETEEQKVGIFAHSSDIAVDLLDNELTVSQLETNLTIKLPFLEISRKVTKAKK